MNIKKLFISSKKTPEQEYLLALEIHESLIKTAVWTLEQNKPVIVSLGSFEMWDSEESLINGIDASLSSATKNLLVPPQKTILGLPEPWLDGDKIHPSKTSLIKHVIKKLDLKPIGLVTTMQAVIHHLKKTEGAPPSVILLEMCPDKVIVAVVKLGKIKAIEEVGRSGELSKDVQEGLARLDLNQLPPRFILSNGSKLESEQQQLLSYPWQDNLPFIHLPKVEILPADFSIKAVALAGGKEAINTLEDTIPESPVKKPTTLKNKKLSMSDIGFNLEDTPKPKVKNKVKPKPDIPVQHKSVKPQVKIKNLKLFLGITVLMLIPIISIIAFFSLATANITVMVKEKPLLETVNILFGTKTDYKGIVLPANVKTLSASVKESISTTGDMLVGEKAIGTVTLYNGTDNAIVVKSGTRIKSDNLAFLVMSDAKVASVSAIIENGHKVGEDYGRVSGVKVKAVDIGGQYNLAKNTQFSVGQHSRSVIYAVAEESFSGGTSRTVKAVSKNDRERLLSLASEKIVAEVNTQLKKQNSDMSSLVISDMGYTDMIYSAEIHEEADTLDLELRGKVEVLVYSNDKVIDQFIDKILPQSNSEMTLLRDKAKIKYDMPIETDENTYTVKATISGLLVPIIDNDQFISQVKGKKISKLKNILEIISGYQKTKVIIKPSIPILSGYIPLNPKHILLEVTTVK